MFKLPFFSFGKEKESASTNESSSSTLILGLGNPGQKYEQTYHNAGHLYVESLAETSFKRYKSFSFAKRDNLVLAKSLTFMNQSGLAARGALRYFNLKPENLIVAHDDSDLPLGEYKITKGQGSAGHKGVQSVIDHLKSKEFTRLRIGIRGQARGKAREFVLKPMSKKELENLQEAFRQISLPV